MVFPASKDFTPIRLLYFENIVNILIVYRFNFKFFYVQTLLFKINNNNNKTSFLYFGLLIITAY